MAFRGVPWGLPCSRPLPSYPAPVVLVPDNVWCMRLDPQPGATPGWDRGPFSIEEQAAKSRPDRGPSNQALKGTSANAGD